MIGWKLPRTKLPVSLNRPKPRNPLGLRGLGVSGEERIPRGAIAPLLDSNASK